MKKIGREQCSEWQSRLCGKQRCCRRSCMKDMHGDIVVEEDKIWEVRRTHYEKLSNEEFPWDREALPVGDAINESCKG